MRVNAAQSHQTFWRKPERVANRPEVLFHHVTVEAVVSGGNWRVRREHGLPRDATQGLVEADALGVHPVTDHFQPGKALWPSFKWRTPGVIFSARSRTNAADAEE